MALKGHCSLPWFLLKCSQNLTYFLEVSNSSQKFERVLRSFKQFSEVTNSSLGSLKQFSEVSNSSRGLKQFSAVSNCPRTLKQFLLLGDTFCDLVLLLIVIKFASKVGLMRNMEFLQCMDDPEDGCQQLNLIGRCFRNNKIINYHIIHNTTIVKLDCYKTKQSCGSFCWKGE